LLEFNSRKGSSLRTAQAYSALLGCFMAILSALSAWAAALSC